MKALALIGLVPAIPIAFVCDLLQIRPQWMVRWREWTEQIILGED